ncbi:molybdopterin-dependent oxidoreductase [Litchfieldella xinjiangensis]|uniref:molybdopterin-dependent oxidoreductase n=1 Tax=Litchfieldella xinjiangensis TaxID=1166948 RepID=UPI0005BA194C|nr:molybdopterin-dependent oxidoreductase [Halomonas xinjiangensis]
MTKRFPLLAMLMLGVVAVTSVASADTLPDPQGPVILKVSGAIAQTNADGEAHFDYDMLMSLSREKTVTHTPWTEGPRVFEGPLVRDVMAAVGARGETLKVTALNNFSANVPMSDIQRYDVLLALKKDGERMQVRNFGPIFVLYPFDDHPELLNETIRFRSVWQVARIDVLP